MVTSGMPSEAPALILARSARRPVASAEACKVYCAVDASDSRIRRAIVARRPAGAVVWVGAVPVSGARRARAGG